MSEINADVSETWEARRWRWEQAHPKPAKLVQNAIKLESNASVAHRQAAWHAEHERLLEAERERSRLERENRFAINQQIKPGATIGQGIENRFTESLLDGVDPHTAKYLRNKLRWR